MLSGIICTTLYSESQWASLQTWLKHCQGHCHLGAKEDPHDYKISCLSLHSDSWRRRMGAMMHTYNPSYSGGGCWRITRSRLAWTKLETLSQEQNENKRIEGMAQVIRVLPSLCKALGSIHGTESTHTHAHTPQNSSKEVLYLSSKYNHYYFTFLHGSFTFYFHIL
jgi:hypothetical protein